MIFIEVNPLAIPERRPVVCHIFFTIAVVASFHIAEILKKSHLNYRRFYRANTGSHMPSGATQHYTQNRGEPRSLEIT